MSSKRKLRFLQRLNQVELNPYSLKINKNVEIMISRRENNLRNIMVFKLNDNFNVTFIVEPNFSITVPKHIIYN